MGSAPSVVVIHSSKIQEDRNTLLAIFPEKFNVETQPQSSSLLLVGEQLTLILIASSQAKGTYASMVLEEDMIRQCAERAVTYGVLVQEEILFDNALVKFDLPGGAIVVATTPHVWKDSSSRKSAVENILAKPLVVHNGDGMQDIARRQKPPKSRRRPLGNSVAMKRSMSLPDIPPMAATQPPTAMNRVFPSLRVQALASQGRFVNFPLNSNVPIPVDTDLFVGTILLIMRPHDPQDDPYWNGRIFSKKKRRVVLQLQGKFKYKPKGVVYAGMEVSDPMKLGLLASGLCNILLKLSQKFNAQIHYSFGDDQERPHICFPASTFFERLIVTSPGEKTPEMGEDFDEPADSVQQRKAYKAKIDWNTEDTYSMSFHSMYVDFPTWSVVKLPIGKDMNLQTFWGNSLASIVLYEVGASDKRHLLSSIEYIVAIKMKYLGKDAGDGIGIDDQPSVGIDDQSSEGAWSEEQFVRESTLLGLATPVLGDDSEEELEFFDTVQNQSSLFDSSIIKATELTPSSSHASALRSIDESCPCVIDMWSKRGKYISVYAFQGKTPESISIFHTYDTCVQFLGAGLGRRKEVDDMFSHRLSSFESTRRLLGLRYSKARLGKASPNMLAQFQKVRTALVTQFLQRDAPASKKGLGLLSGFVARARSDRHWVEEWGILTEEDIIFYHTDKTKPNFRISRSSVIKVGKLPDKERPLLPVFSYLSIETFGRTTYLMFRLEAQRDAWDVLLNEKTVLRAVNNSFTNHLIDVNEPMEEFLHKSTIWDCNKRRILNCRLFSFCTPRVEDRPDSLRLAERALLKATALQPKGPNDADLCEFLDCAAALKEADARTLDQHERLAFFLNVYHVMIMHAFIVLGPPDSSLKWLSYFNNIAYQCSDDIFSLAELEHNIIRAEMSFPSQFLSRFVLPKSQYHFALAKSDFRINFALNCGSLSMPSGAVPIYKPEQLHQQLDFVTRDFLKLAVSVKQKGYRDVSISFPRVCQWFADDFGDGSASDILKTITPYLSEEKRKIIGTIWRDRKQCYDLGIWDVKYLPYIFDCRFLTLVDKFSK